MITKDSLIISEVVRWGTDNHLSQDKNHDSYSSNDCSCDDHCNDCNDGNCYDCACDNDGDCRSEW
jgi:hypothetical protein